MITCYRSVHKQFNTPEQIFSGFGAFSTAGRWNHLGDKVIYCSNNVEASASERAFNSIHTLIKLYNSKVSSKGKRIPNSYFEQIINQEFLIAKTDFRLNEDLIDLRNASVLEQQLKLASLTIKSREDLLKNNYQFNKELTTRNLSRFLKEQGHPGFIFSSARTTRGDTVVIFEDNINSKDVFTNIRTCKLKISALNTDKKTLTKGEIASENFVKYSCQFQEGIADILIL